MTTNTQLELNFEPLPQDLSICQRIIAHLEQVILTDKEDTPYVSLNMMSIKNYLK